MNYETFAFVMLILAIFNFGFGFWLGVKVCTWLTETVTQPMHNWPRRRGFLTARRL